MVVESVLETLRSRLLAVEARLSAACARAGRRREEVTLVAVTKTVGVEAAKQGFAPIDVPDLAAILDGQVFVSVRGLMTMAALVEDPEKARPAFVSLRGLRDQLRATVDRERHPLTELSMGMSNDFEV